MTEILWTTQSENTFYTSSVHSIFLFSIMRNFDVFEARKLFSFVGITG